MPTAGTWLRLGAAELDGDEVLTRADVPGSTVAAVVADLAWDTQGPPPVTDIPYDWLTQPLAFRSDLLRNVATVTQTGGVRWQQSDAASVAEFGEVELTADLGTAVDVDPANLAAHILTYHATQASAVPRQRIPTLTLNLAPRSDLERWTILGLGIGDRVRITGAPATWPEGTATAVIEGIGRAINLDRPVVVWNLAAVVGSTPGAAGPWFRLNSSFLGGADKVPF